MNWLQAQIEDYKILLRNVPSGVMSLFVASVILMNLMANREIDLNLDWVALDCGFFVSWMSFLSMDMLTKRFGAKASIKLSIVAMAINLFVCLILFLVMKLPGNWGAYYIYGEESINKALDATFGGTWYVLFGSAVAFLTSSVVNSTMNQYIGSKLENNNFKQFAIRSYISTMVGQFIDNLVFATIVSHVFFGWSWLQVITCSITGALFELFCEVVFSPIGYRVSKQWEAENVGASYLDIQKATKNG